MTTASSHPNTALDPASVSALAEACKRLANARNAFRDQALRDALPAWMPDFKDDAARQAAVDAVCEIYLGDRLHGRPYSGVLCVSEKSAALADAFAQAKAVFSDKVAAVKGQLGPAAKNVTLNKLLTDDDHGPYVRDKRVAKALAAVNFADVDLTAAYRRIRLFREVEGVSFFWQVNRREVTRVTHAQALELVTKKLSRPDQANELTMALQLLAAHRKDLARVRNRPQPQLRANVYYYAQGERLRELIPTPAPVLVVGDTLPLLRWPGPVEDKVPNLPRIAANKIADTPLIPALSLYPYAKDVH